MIQSLWWGKLGTMQKLSIASYLKNGHDYHLYTYGIDGIDRELPKGVVFENASEILPYSDVSLFTHLAHFADWFRYNLLLKKGGWWVDIDTVCLKPFDFNEDTVMTVYDRHDGEFGVTNAYIKASQGSPVMKWAIDKCLSVKDNWKYMAWEVTNNNLCTEAVKVFGITPRPSSEFSPIPYWRWHAYLEDTPIPEDAYALHLCKSMWGATNKEAVFPSTCLYERLKAKYLK